MKEVFFLREEKIRGKFEKFEIATRFAGKVKKVEWFGDFGVLKKRGVVEGSVCRRGKRNSGGLQGKSPS